MVFPRASRVWMPASRLGEAFKGRWLNPVGSFFVLEPPELGHLVTCSWFQEIRRGFQLGSVFVSPWFSKVLAPSRWWFSGRISEALTLWFPGDRWVYLKANLKVSGVFVRWTRWWRGTIQKTPGKSAWTAQWHRWAGEPRSKIEAAKQWVPTKKRRYPKVFLIMLNLFLLNMKWRGLGHWMCFFLEAYVCIQIDAVWKK